MTTAPVNIVFGGTGGIGSSLCRLLEPGNNFITGQVIAVDGGLGSLQPRFVQPTSSRS